MSLTTLCTPGNHPINFAYRGMRWLACSPDVPGIGLPWDMPTLICALGTFIFLGGVIVYLGYLMCVDRGDR